MCESIVKVGWFCVFTVGEWNPSEVVRLMGERLVHWSEGVGRTVTIEMGCFGRESVWKGGWFWVKVEGLVFTVEDDECG